MCRLAAYLGNPIVMDQVLVKPKNSIIMQSLHAKESDIRTNGDGFGLGWYKPNIDPIPGLFTSISPAWNDRNLLNLTAKIESDCFFAHIRAASAGGVTPFNCHPFVHGEWMLMHNGGISDFIKIKRHIRRLLDDDVYNWIQGETDSEHFFALFLQLAKGKDLNQSQVVLDVLQETFNTIADLLKNYDITGPSYYNICLTDGRRLFASRYCTDIKQNPESLHYLTESSLIRNAQRQSLQDIEKNDSKFVLIASERLTSFNTEWIDVPKNHMMVVENSQIDFQPIKT